MELRQLYFIFFFLTVLFNSNITRVQSNEVDFQTWPDFTYTYTIRNRSNIGADMGVRGLVYKNEWNQLYFRPTYKYYFNEVIQVAGGVALFSTISEVLENTNEIRIFLQINSKK